MALTLASAMPPATQNGSQAESVIYIDFSFCTFLARSFYDEKEETFTEDLSDIFKKLLLVYT